MGGLFKSFFVLDFTGQSILDSLHFEGMEENG